MYDSLLSGDYTAETTEDYGDEICNLPYPGNMGKRGKEEHRQEILYERPGNTEETV